MNDIAVVLSAGTGKRFGSVSPKQFIMLRSKPVLYYSLKNFQGSNFVSSIVVVSNRDFYNKTKLVSSAFNKVCAVIEGGARRQDSVWNALDWIKRNVGEDCRSVFIHDAARPLFNAVLLQRLHTASLTHPAVIPVVPLEDTVKTINGSMVGLTLNRSEIFRVQTPQVFNFGMLYRAYASFPEGMDATDDASVVEKSGHAIYTVQGERENMKITYPVDLKIAEGIIESTIEV